TAEKKEELAPIIAQTTPHKPEVTAAAAAAAAEEDARETAERESSPAVVALAALLLPWTRALRAERRRISPWPCRRRGSADAPQPRSNNHPSPSPAPSTVCSFSRATASPAVSACPLTVTPPRTT